jgi:iron complex transport system permease protein
VIPYGLLFITTGFIICISRAKALNALILGDELSHSLGFSPRKERFILFVSVGLMTAASVSMGGMIGFIGLLIPHIGRFLIGSDSKVLIPVSALGGGMLLCLADLIAKSILSPMELPAGAGRGNAPLSGRPYCKVHTVTYGTSGRHNYRDNRCTVFSVPPQEKGF